jgi:hypothetical protein
MSGREVHSCGLVDPLFIVEAPPAFSNTTFNNTIASWPHTARSGKDGCKLNLTIRLSSRVRLASHLTQSQAHVYADR